MILDVSISLLRTCRFCRRKKGAFQVQTRDSEAVLERCPGPQTPGLLPRYLGAQRLRLSPRGVLVSSSVLMACVRPFPVTPRATHGCSLFCQEPDVHLASWDSLYPKSEFSPHPKQAPEEQFQTCWHTAPLLITHAASRQRPAPHTPQPLPRALPGSSPLPECTSAFIPLLIPSSP